MNPKNTIKKNLKRRSYIVDQDIKFYKKIPLPTWIELSLIDVCNRSCSFCPKSDPSIAPNTYQKVSSLLIDKLSNELKKIKSSIGESNYNDGRFKEVSDIFNSMSTSDDFEEFLTLPAYNLL